MVVKHTPGPWEIGDRNEAGDFYIARLDAPEYVAIVTGGPFLASEITKANARLIAAAPALLEALEGTGVMTFWGEWHLPGCKTASTSESMRHTDANCIAAQAAIAQAHKVPAEAQSN